jgi:hypothetical protein
MVLPTALLIAMVVLMTATALLGQSRSNLAFAGLKAQQSRRLFLAQGAANEFIDRLNSDASLLAASQSAPYNGTWQDITYQVWTEADPTDGQIRHVVARAYPTDRPSDAVSFEKVVQAGADLSGYIATNVPDLDVSNPDKIFLANSASPSWTALPPVPRSGWSKLGNPVSGSGNAGTLIFGGGDNQGRLFFVYAPSIDGGLDGIMNTSDDEPVGRTALEFIVKFGDGNDAVPNTLMALLPYAQMLVEDPTFDVDNRLILSKNAAVFQYDTASANWTKLPAMKNYEYVSGSFVAQQKDWHDGTAAGPYHVYGLAGPMACDENNLYVPIYKEGADLVMRYNFASSNWSPLPPVPARSANGTDISYVATTGTDVYVQAYPYKRGSAFNINTPLREPPRILRLNGTSWQPLPEVPASIVANGHLAEAAGPASDLGCMAAGRDGALYVSSKQSDPNTVFKFAGGRWTAMAGPIAGGGSYPEALHADIGVDGSGTVLMRSPNTAGPDEMYTVRDSTYQRLPDLPGGVLYSSQMIGGAVRNSTDTVYRSTAAF